MEAMQRRMASSYASWKNANVHMEKVGSVAMDRYKARGKEISERYYSGLGAKGLNQDRKEEPEMGDTEVE